MYVILIVAMVQDLGRLHHIIGDAPEQFRSRYV